MLSIYVPKITNRVKYTFEFVFSELIITDYILYDNFEEFIMTNGFKLIYSKNKTHDIPLTYSKAILFHNDVLEIDIKTDVLNSVPIIFTHNNTEAILPFDPFAAIFYMISRYEEYLLHVRDVHQRYLHTNSIAFKNGFLNVPIVHIWAKMLEDKLIAIFPKLKISHRKYKFLPTIDVDHAFKHINNGFMRVIGGVFKSLLTGDFNQLSEKLSVIFHLKKDPYDTFDYMIKIQQQYKLNFIFFFLMASYGDNDKGCYVYNTKFRNLIRHVRDYAEVGIHPSYLSFTQPTLIEEEKQILEDIIHFPIVKSRQHFLRFEIVSTFRMLIENNITEEFSMGYAETTGFRAGVCIPYYYYDIENDEATKLKIYPLSVMDCTLIKYMKLDSIAALEEIKRIVALIKQYNGLFIPLWHNNSLSNSGEWKNKVHLFEEMIETAIP